MNTDIPSDAVLSFRLDLSNENHHLYRNNRGYWWIHYTLHFPDHTARRVRQSLKTRDIAEARRRRDVVLDRMMRMEVRS